MEIKTFMTNFAELFEDTDPAKLKPATIFRDIEDWSSLGALSLIAMVDEQYNVSLTGDDIRKSTTIQDLYDIVKSK